MCNLGVLTNYMLTHYSDIYFIGGFGTVAWVDVNEYETTQPDKVAVDGAEKSLKVTIPDHWYLVCACGIMVAVC